MLWFSGGHPECWVNRKYNEIYIYIIYIYILNIRILSVVEVSEN